MPSVLEKIKERINRKDEKVDTPFEIVNPMLEDVEIPPGFDKDKVGDYDRIGFARPLGGFFMEFFYAILGAGVVALIIPIFTFLYPYPDSQGWVSISMAIFGFFQFLFNIPTEYAIERFIAEWRIKDPQRMVEYIRFYMWYQMTTGLFLITGISLFIFTGLRTGDKVWLSWLMLIQLSREYPACLGVFKSTIKGLQRFDFEAKINFIQGSIIEKGFEFFTVLIGKYWGAANPAIGEIMGIAIGYAIGTYIDDFFSMWLSAHYLKKTLEPYGITIKDLIMPHVRKEVAKNALDFGLKASIPGFFNSLLGFFSFFWWYDAVPAYAALRTLNNLADDLVNMIRQGEGINIKAAISEAYNNDKKDLTRFYMAQQWKWYGFFMYGIGFIIITFFPILLETLLSVSDAENYLLAIPFIIPNVIHTLIESPSSNADNIIYGCSHPLFVSIKKVLVTASGFFFSSLWLIRLEIPQTYGIPAVIWILPMGNFLAELIGVLVSWVYIHKKIVSVHIPVWQCFVAPLFPSLIVAGVGGIYRNTIYILLFNSVGSIPTAVVSILFAFVGCFMFIYLPFYTYFGGWDDYGLEMFREAVSISGPSRIFFVPIYKLSIWLADKSPLHNKYPIPWKGADRNSLELMIERYKNDMKTLGKDPSSL
ncbi:MAG: hypothetical protein GF364_19085 [Candidatus Lokiarchaeota archaeon]|nr:hypothetical protein [Candidatus Lokiarchaeota archaeon]